MNPMVSKFAEEIDNSDTEYDTAVVDTANNDEDDNDFLSSSSGKKQLSSSSGKKEKQINKLGKGFEGLFSGAGGSSQPVKNEDGSDRDLEDFLGELASKEGPAFESHEGYDSL
jgi:hypothetical protein